MSAEARSASDAEPFERRLATILMADIVGYSRLMEANEERTLRVFRGHREIFDALLAQHRGRIFNTAGDAVLAEFPSAVEAVRCATEIQSALATRNDHLVPDERMQFRIGINLGDVIVQGTDLLGDGVNVAARIQTAAPPGGVCVAGSVYDQIRNKLSLEFHPMGERTFKNISQPVRVFSIGEGGDPAAAKPPVASPTGAPVASPAAGPPAPGASRPFAAIAAGVIALALAAGGGWWYVQDRESKAAEVARAAEARATERIRAAEAARRKAEEDAAAKIAVEREARLKSELEAAQREASEARKRADASKVAAAAPASRTPVVAPGTKDAPVASGPATGPAATAKGSADVATTAAAAASPAPAAAPRSASPATTTPPVGAGSASAGYPNDGLYRGRACWELPGSGKAPGCWNFDIAVAQNRIDSTWIGSYGGGKPSTIRGQVTSSGQVNALFEGYTVRGNAISGDVSGRVNEGRMTLSSTLPNRAVITATATRIR